MMLGELEHILLSLGKLNYQWRQGQLGQLRAHCETFSYVSSWTANCPTVWGGSRCCCCPAVGAAETEIFSTNFPISGEKLEREEVDILIKECCDPEDDDGFIPYERKCNILTTSVSLSAGQVQLSNSLNYCQMLTIMFDLYNVDITSHISAFLRRVCAGPHPEMYEDW